MTDASPDPLAQALGRIPSGLFLVTTEQDGAPLGFLGSFVMQVGFDPPTVCVAVGEGREHLAAMRESGRFTLSVIDAKSSAVMGPFFKPREDGVSPYDDLAHHPAPSGVAVLSDTLAWLDCKVSGEHSVGDHVVVFGEVLAGGILHEGDPTVHLRKNGLSY